jgi:hypothetical protein
MIVADTEEVRNGTLSFKSLAVLFLGMALLASGLSYWGYRFQQTSEMRGRGLALEDASPFLPSPPPLALPLESDASLALSPEIVYDEIQDMASQVHEELATINKRDAINAVRVMKAQYQLERCETAQTEIGNLLSGGSKP